MSQTTSSGVMLLMENIKKFHSRLSKDYKFLYEMIFLQAYLVFNVCKNDGVVIEGVTYSNTKTLKRALDKIIADLGVPQWKAETLAQFEIGWREWGMRLGFTNYDAFPKRRNGESIEPTLLAKIARVRRTDKINGPLDAAEAAEVIDWLVNQIPVRVVLRRLQNRALGLDDDFVQPSRRINTADLLHQFREAVDWTLYELRMMILMNKPVSIRRIKKLHNGLKDKTATL